MSAALTLPPLLYTSQVYWERRGILKIQYWISCAVGNKHAHSSFSPLLYLKCALSGFSFVLFAVSLLLNFACFNILFRLFSLCVQYGKSEKSSVLSEAKFIDPCPGGYSWLRHRVVVPARHVMYPGGQYMPKTVDFIPPVRYYEFGYRVRVHAGDL